LKHDDDDDDDDDESTEVEMMNRQAEARGM